MSSNPQSAIAMFSDSAASDPWAFAGFHAAVFLAVVVVLLAIQWLFDRRRGGR
ncbi:MAG TPA: hypothetical protein VD968_07045 [Pyrinomonadaceae bacterium]|nr:hypothetical protein [Pyrinomonadaceae bacterium]